jgi:hypothetical protein
MEAYRRSQQEKRRRKCKGSAREVEVFVGRIASRGRKKNREYV